MADLKPLGSEKLSSTDKLKRIIELSNYNYHTDNSSKTQNSEYISECNNGGVYGIVKEKNNYYVKRGLNENTLDYIGGMFMKDKNKFSSYSDALKRLNLLKGQEELQESTKYVLKTKTPTPVESEPAPMEEPTEPTPTPADTPEDFGGDVEDMDGVGGETKNDSKPSDYMSEVQKFSGKLGQELRDQKERMKSDDIKYVLNMVISAVNLDELDTEDLEEISKKFDRDEEPMDDEEMDMGNEEMETEPEAEEELSEDGIDALEEFINTPLEQNEIDVSKFADINEDDIEDDEDVEIDLDEIKKEINNSINTTLSKYFKN